VTFRIRSTRIVYSGWARFRVAEVETPGGDIIEREIEDHGEAVAVLPYDPVRKCAVLVRQFRTPAAFAGGLEYTLEAIAGIIEDGNPEATALPQAREEAGLDIRALDFIGTFWTAPGISTERMSLFLAAYEAKDRTGAGGGLISEHEAITVVEIALAALARDADEGRLDDLKTFALLQTLRLKRPELFS
jgi:nudix-type nucleoside diphosphatase (YffH/AdpP family)